MSATTADTPQVLLEHQLKALRLVAVACLGVAGWHFKSGRGYLGWGVTGVALMVISGLGRMAEGFITQAQGIQ